MGSLKGGNMDKLFGQHGDVLLKVCREIPEGAKKLKIFNGFVIEKGEGVHTHTLIGKNIETDCEVYEKDGVMYLNVLSPVKIDHEEHKQRTLTPGIYRKDIEREFSYEEMESRKTID